MYKSLCYTVITTLTFLMGIQITWAQINLFGSTPTTQETTQNKTSPVLSPDEFSQRVNAINQQSHSAFQQQLSDQLSQIKTPTITPAPLPPAPSSSTPDKPVIPPAPTAKQKTPAEASTDGSPTEPPAQTAEQPSQQPTPEQGTDVYTGFPSSTSQQGSGNTSQGGGQWNVNY